MNGFQLRTRVVHFFRARHWRGHGIHSPMVYSLVREVVMRCRKRDLALELIARFGEQRVVVVENVEQVWQNQRYCIILKEPFRSKEQQASWELFYGQKHCTAVICRGWMLVFFDPKLQKQCFWVRS